ncbi:MULTISPECIES: STAS domain-containing protein [unclassified Streptomyces]|uniref:STAS domain-containing protein n=1 Tax=unclassified Streptomyces TaxID=2593676 RepID=UPI0036C92031
MTAFPDTDFELEATTGEDGALRVRLSGDLTWDTTDELLTAVRAHLASASVPGDVHLDCARMTLCDSMGLSTFLALHRDTTAAGVRLSLERRPAHLDRMLVLTGTYEHLTGLSEARAGDGDAPGGEAENPQRPSP